MPRTVVQLHSQLPAFRLYVPYGTEQPMKKCETCDKEFEPVTSRARFCSRKCFPARNPRHTEECPACGKTQILTGIYRRGLTCRDCASDRMSGPNSPSWRGGAQHWSPGRHGKDKNGLSWVVQRRLAWERDNLTCQHCGEKKGRNPDVHHIDPWMNSQSHALDNLICLCQSCHLKEEAKVQEVWGGTLVVTGPSVKKPVKERPVCPSCGEQTRANRCPSCTREFILTHYTEMSQASIGAILGISQANVCQWFNRLNLKVDRLDRYHKFHQPCV